MIQLKNKINKIFENVQTFNGEDPFLKLIQEFQLKGVEFAEVESFTRYAICTNKNESQSKQEPNQYYMLNMDDKGKVKYYRFDFKVDNWNMDQGDAIDKEAFEFAVVPGETSSKFDIRDKEAGQNNLKDKDLIKGV